jgi:hypothetical protein
MTARKSLQTAAIEAADGGHTCLGGRNPVSCEGGERRAVVMRCSRLFKYRLDHMSMVTPLFVP